MTRGWQLKKRRGEKVMIIFTAILWTLLVVAFISSVFWLWKRQASVALVAMANLGIVFGYMALMGYITPVLEDPTMIGGLLLASITSLTCAPIWWYSQFSKNRSKEGKRISPIPMGQDS